jgi:phenylpyruvate tautomerase PptA (4-oxalocrotonate tautomerase family)
VPDRTQNVLIPLPCPFCGAEPRIFSRSGISTHFIECNEAGHLASAAAESPDVALAIWNTRATPAPQASTDYDAWKQAWNDNRGPLPQATKLTGERLDKLRRRIKEGLTLEEFTRAAWACSHTEFLLRGTPKQEFHATFDWLVSNSGVVAKVLDGTYGPTGKSETELKAEQEEKKQLAAQATEDLLRHLSKKMQQGGEVGPDLQTSVFLWELEQARATGEGDKVYAVWVDRMAHGVKLSGPVTFRLKEWVASRVTEVTTDTTATST